MGFEANKQTQGAVLSGWLAVVFMFLRRVNQL